MVVVILGPTSSGKTSLGLDLCKKYGGSIVSADSRQIYKYLDIGTGKVPVRKNTSTEKVKIRKYDNRWIIDGIDIWGYDLITPDRYYSAYDYALFALDKLRSLQEQGNQPCLVGGTGFYIDVVTGRVKPSEVAPDFELRKELEKASVEDLRKMLMSLNPRVYSRIDQKNKVRLVRAVEKELSDKKPPSPLPYLEKTEFVMIGLTAPRKFLYERADIWLESAWDSGLVDEVHHLISLGYEKSPRLQGLVYKTVLSHINGELGESEAKQRIKYDLHAYIRRQQTYFRRKVKPLHFKKIPGITWFDVSDDNFREKIYTLVEEICRFG